MSATKAPWLSCARRASRLGRTDGVERPESITEVAQKCRPARLKDRIARRQFRRHMRDLRQQSRIARERKNHQANQRRIQILRNQVVSLSVPNFIDLAQHHRHSLRLVLYWTFAHGECLTLQKIEPGTIVRATFELVGKEFPEGCWSLHRPPGATFDGFAQYLIEQLLAQPSAGRQVERVRDASRPAGHAFDEGVCSLNRSGWQHAHEHDGNGRQDRGDRQRELQRRGVLARELSGSRMSGQ